MLTSDDIDFYDTRSIKRIYILNSEVPIYIFPKSIRISLNFFEEPHKNLMGQTVGILKSFTGGSLSFDIPLNSYFRKDLESKYEAFTEIYLEIEEKYKRKKYVDKLVCSIKSIEVSTDEPKLSSKIELTIFSVFRADILGSGNFEPLFRLNSVYFLELIKDDCYLLLNYFDKKLKQEITLPLNYITSFKTKSKIRNKQKRMDKEGVWLWVYDGVEPMNIKVKARLYDTLDYKDGKVLRDEGKLVIKRNDLPKEETLKALLKLLDSKFDYGDPSKEFGVKGKLPYDIYLTSPLIAGILPTEYTFYLTKVEHKAKDNYIEVDLEFIERREVIKEFEPYKPTDEYLINKKENLFTIKSRAKGEISTRDSNKIIDYKKYSI